MTAQDADHPHLLLWYVSGDLPEEQRLQTDRHLAACDACRREVAAIRAMLETVRAEDRAARETSRFARRDRDSPAPSRPAGTVWKSLSRASWLVACAGFAAGGVLGGAATLWLSAARIDPQEGIRAVSSVALLPTNRGASDPPELSPPGPWAVTVVLPLGAPTGPCRVSIQRADGTRLHEPAGASPQRDGTFTLLIPALEGPASLSLVVETEGRQPGEPPLRYPFEVAAIP